jgi:hypothetical protein
VSLEGFAEDRSNIMRFGAHRLLPPWLLTINAPSAPQLRQKPEIGSYEPAMSSPDRRL